MLSVRKNRDEKKGVKIEFISKDKLRDAEFDEKVNFILGRVKENSILVLEEALTPEEKKELITRSVESITEEFPGIEFSGLEDRSDFLEKFLNNLSKRFFGKERRRGITIVGNSNVMEKVNEERDSVSLLAKFEKF